MMKEYRITYYDGWSIWAAQIGREYIYLPSEEDAKRFAMDRVKGHDWRFDIVVASFAEIV